MGLWMIRLASFGKTLLGAAGTYSTPDQHVNQSYWDFQSEELNQQHLRREEEETITETDVENLKEIQGWQNILHDYANESKFLGSSCYSFLYKSCSVSYIHGWWMQQMAPL